ncbi:MAG: glycoside hydrolase family 73 protein, partial [Turicibacter sp.]
MKAKTKRKRVKYRKFKRNVGCLGIVLVLIASVWGVGKYQAYQTEQSRMRDLAKENLDLAFIVNTVDEIGGEELQLNWKEIVAILGVEKDNVVSGIGYDELIRVSDLFVEGNRVKSFREALASSNFELKDVERAYDYLEDLEEYGYVAHKTSATSEEMIFINAIKQSAINNYETSGILPSITIAQAILESNWGQSKLALEAKNLFGIKVGVGWEGEIMTYETREGFDQVVIDDFRKYESVGDSVTDHATFLVKNPRYLNHGVFEAKTYRTQAKALEEAGYSTAMDESGNKTYAKMLGELIRQYNLQLIDHELNVG